MAFKKKQVQLTPEMMVEEANLIVDQQYDYFRNMAEEVKVAISIRNSAVTELENEIASLESKLVHKRNTLEYTKDSLEADNAFIERLENMYGA